MVDFKECVDKARKGDADAFAELYSAVYKDMYYIALCNLRNQDDAADAVSDAVLDAFKGIGKLKSIDAFRQWIFKILAVKIKQRQTEYISRRQNIVDIKSKPEEQDAENRYAEVEIVQELAFLNESERLCFSMFVVCGYSSEEIAALTGMKASTVRSHLMRGKEKLRKQLA